MASYKSRHPGSEIDTAVDRALKLPNVTSRDAGKIVKVSSAGKFVAEEQSSGSGVTSIGGATGAIPLGAGLSMINGALSATGGGGGKQLYMHTIECTLEYGGFYLNIVNANSTAYTTYEDVVNDNWGTQCIAFGESTGVADRTLLWNVLIYPARGYEDGRVIVIGTSSAAGPGAVTLSAYKTTVTAVTDRVTAI